MPININPNRLQESLQTKQLGRKIFYANSVSSTNKWAKKLAKLEASEGTVVVARTQTSGHGRLGRKWISPAGGLWFSVILRPNFDVDKVAKLVFVASLAVAEVLHELYGLDVETKWPNDVLIDGKKVCGILAETSTQNKKASYVVVGIGINANFDVKKSLPQKLWENTLSLETKLGQKIRLEELFRALLEKLEDIYHRFLKTDFTLILGEWKKHARFLGHEVEVTSGSGKLRGLAVDVDDDGSLIIKTRDGTIKHVLVGDISVKQ